MTKFNKIAQFIKCICTNITTIKIWNGKTTNGIEKKLNKTTSN